MKRPGRVAVGDRVRFEGRIRGVLAVAAQAVTATDGEEPYRVVPLLELFAASDFEVMDSPVRMPLPAASLLEAFPAREVERALWWEGHILEVLHGLPPNAEPGTTARPEYGPDRSLTARQRAKAAELTAAGHKVSASTVAHRRRRYQERGVLGLADHRPVRRTAEFGEVDDAAVAAMRIPATFIYAGIDIEHGSLLTGTRGAQIAGRFTLIPTRPFPYNSEWRGLVATMEKALALRRHRPGTLARLDRYLHDRTSGMIGALSHQIRGAAIDAIFNGTEKITKAGLKAVPLDVAAESPHVRGPRSSR
ncbi:hypothetical protein [Streptomyces sp. LaPpAH-108]|uniref:hypothetical protein n=1 Tax=Streptomyces sp. LaPpAH-108 TaxID=1155714 RepID=UPI0003AB2141|nr:hypothetical protein [Streptomyces sp. LaPpAH-108]